MPDVAMGQKERYSNDTDDIFGRNPSPPRPQPAEPAAATTSPFLRCPSAASQSATQAHRLTLAVDVRAVRLPVRAGWLGRG